MRALDHDVYFKKVIPFAFARHSLRFRVSQDLFSSHEIDVGTRFLLRTLVDVPARSVLDVGCGYGPVGLTLKRLDEARVVRLVDRDALAVEYARRNAALNGLGGVEVYASLGYDDVRRREFDLIASNVPGKAGPPVIAALVREAGGWLAPGGLAALVVVNPLVAAVEEVLRAMPGTTVEFQQARSGHTVVHYRVDIGQSGTGPVRPSAFEAGVYDRTMSAMPLGDATFSLQTAYGLPEFDGPSRATELLIEGLREARLGDADRVVVFNPGQGHLPVALWVLMRPVSLALVGRDLLALRVARRNLVRHECPPDRLSVAHQVGLAAPNGDRADVIAGVVREEEGPAATALLLEQVADRLAPGGTIFLAGSSTAVTRLVRFVQRQTELRVSSRRRRGGASALVLSR